MMRFGGCCGGRLGRRQTLGKINLKTVYTIPQSLNTAAVFSPAAGAPD